MTLLGALAFILCTAAAATVLAVLSSLDRRPLWRASSTGVLVALGLTTQFATNPGRAWPIWAVAILLALAGPRRLRPLLLGGLALAGPFLLDPGTAQAAAQHFFAPQRARVGLVLGGFLLCVAGGSLVVEQALHRIKGLPHSSEEAEATARGDEEEGRTRVGVPAGGMVIGMLERSFVYAGVLVGHPEAVALIVAMKSVARFPEFTSPAGRRFAEYFLIGTLISLLVALAIAYLVQAALRSTG